jgi:hypothetical protein
MNKTFRLVMIITERDIPKPFQILHLGQHICPTQLSIVVDTLLGATTALEHYE